MMGFKEVLCIFIELQMCSFLLIVRYNGYNRKIVYAS